MGAIFLYQVQKMYLQLLVYFMHLLKDIVIYVDMIIILRSHVSIKVKYRLMVNNYSMKTLEMSLECFM